MIIVHYSDGTAKLRSETGQVTEILSGRRYSEVICKEQDIAKYTDGSPYIHSKSPRTVFTRNEILKAMRTAMPELYAQVVQAYQQYIELNVWWNSSNVIDLEDNDCAQWVASLGITQEIIDALRRVIDGDTDNA